MKKSEFKVINGKTRKELKNRKVVIYGIYTFNYQEYIKN